MVLWGRSVLGSQKVPRKVPPRFRQGSTKVPPRFRQGFTMVPRRVAGFLGQIRLGLPKGSAEGFTEIPPRFSKFRGVSASLGQIRLGLPQGSAESSAKVPLRFHQGSTMQGSTKLLQVSWCLWFSGADPSWAAKRFRGRFHQGSPSFVVSLVPWGGSVLVPGSNFFLNC